MLLRSPAMLLHTQGQDLPQRQPPPSLGWAVSSRTLLALGCWGQIPPWRISWHKREEYLLLRDPSLGPSTSLRGLPAPCTGWSPSPGKHSAVSPPCFPWNTDQPEHFWPGCGAVCSTKGSALQSVSPAVMQRPVLAALGFSVIAFASSLPNAQQGWHRWQ